MRFPVALPAGLAQRADGAPRSGRSAPEAELRFGYLLGVELARLLINLAPTPRAFRYAAVDRFQLARRGLGVPRSDYKVVELPPDVPIELIEIPALEPDAVHALAFWASVVPHVGLDGPDGHFLASYEAVRKRLPEAAEGANICPIGLLALWTWTRSSRRSPRGESARSTAR